MTFPTTRFLNPLNMLILLGLVCQGYTWDTHVVPIGLALIWFLCVRFRFTGMRLTPDGEALFVLLAFIVVKFLSSRYEIGYNRWIFLGGNVLAVYQVLRLLAPSFTQRQQKLSVLVALMHLGVGTQVLFDFRIFIIFVVAAITIPKAFYDLESERYNKGASAEVGLALRVKDLAYIAIAAIVFFLIFPRVRFQSAGAAGFAGIRGGGGPLDRELDMRQGGEDSGDQLILRVEGPTIGYLKTSSMDEFDGAKWTASHWLIKWQRAWVPPDADRFLSRSVKVLDYKRIGDTLPTDGNVQSFSGTLPTRPMIAGDGSVRLDIALRSNVSYVYWTLPELPEQTLSEKERNRYLEIPPPSANLQTWLDAVVGTNQDPMSIANAITAHFQANFQYDLGAPDLSRVSPMDEFIFQQRRGHCERFASALAVLLRMKEIPARVAVGYVPVEKNDLGEFYNIRAKHAHAWTEAFIDGKGWMIFDATPYGTGSVAAEPRTLALTLYEWIEYVWYSKIIEFGIFEQQTVYGLVGVVVGKIIAGARQLTVFVALIGALLVTTLLIGKVAWKRIVRLLRTIRLRRVDRIVEAQHFYGQMVRLLGKDRIYRRNSETPLEFLRTVEEKHHPLCAQIRVLTNYFCEIRYGNRELTPDVWEVIQTALRDIRVPRSRWRHE